MTRKEIEKTELNIDSLFESLGKGESPYEKELKFNHVSNYLGEKYPETEKEFVLKINEFFKVEAGKKGIDFVSTFKKSVPNLDKNS